MTFAKLHLAVSYTDEFAFEEARAQLRPLEAVAPEVMGLRHHGQLMSSLGQHAAFLGDLQTAVGYFKAAVRDFSGLSHRVEGRQENTQTLAYLLTGLMDDPSTDPKTLDLWLFDYFGQEPSKAIPRLLDDPGNTHKYKHHILLRYMFSAFGTERLRASYLKRRKDWQGGQKHPWELIEFYRAMLLPEGAKRQDRLQLAYALACEGGETLRLIAAVILGGILCQDASRRKEYTALVAKVRKELPRLGDARLAALQAQAEHPVPPLELAQRVLPFNFR